jgi:hypothetical protein
MRPTTADESLQALVDAQEELRGWQAAALNEADTRAKVLDRVFKDILGWDESAVRRERRTLDGEYLDYWFTSQSNRLVVEAKRAGTYFEVPAGISLRARRDGILSHAPSLHGALEQVVRYCKSEGVPVAVVSNGLQFAVTLVYKPLGGAGYDTVVFGGLERILSHYVLFWNLLSPTGSCEDRLRELLASAEFLRPPPQYSERLLDQVHLPDDVMDRNPVDVALAPVIRHYFSELVGEGRENVLRQAYVESSRQAQYGKQLDALLADHAPRLGLPIRELKTRRREAPALDLALEEDIAEDEGRPEGEVLLLVGGVGAGKTTFMHRYFRFLISENLKHHVVPVILDFTKTSEDADELGTFVDPETLRQLEEACREFRLGEWGTLQQIYQREIAGLRKGLLAPYWQNDRDRFWQLVSDDLRQRVQKTEQHVRRVIDYLRARHEKQVCVVFDNVDQLGQDFQHRALRLAFQKCRTWGCLGILAVREETYWRFRNSPPLDAYHRYAHHIAAPRIVNVLSRRLDLAKNERGAQSISVRSQRGLEFEPISLGEFLEILIDSFLGQDNQNILLLECLSANDVRQALDMFGTFLTSGHTNTDEYIRTYVTSRSYTVPFHHVLRSIAFAERRYYDSGRSLIENVFSVEDDGFYSHFQKIRILRYLQSLRQLDAVPGRGFLRVDRMFNAFRSVLSDEEGLRRVLDPLLKHRLIEAANGYRVQGEAADLVRITSAGHYYLANLIEQFAYLDLVSMDTPIKSSEWFGKVCAAALTDRGLVQGIRERLAKVEVFLQYLAQEEEAEQPYLQESGLPSNAIEPIMAPVLSRFETQREYITRQAEKWGRDRPRAEQP